jgi:hypothetical protein
MHSELNMKTLLKGLLLSCVALSLTGCGSVVGHWTMDSVTPASAQADFHLAVICMAKDGTYMCCAGPNERGHTGTYQYDAMTKMLTFKGADGKERSYKAEVTGDTMKVMPAEKDKEWTAVMKRGECPCGKKCGGAACDPQKCCFKECPMAKEKKVEAKKAEPKKAGIKKAEPAKPESKKHAPKNP